MLWKYSYVQQSHRPRGIGARKLALLILSTYLLSISVVLFQSAPWASLGEREARWRELALAAPRVSWRLKGKRDVSSPVGRSVGIEEAHGFTLGEVVSTRSGGICPQLWCSIS